MGSRGNEGAADFLIEKEGGSRGGGGGGDGGGGGGDEKDGEDVEGKGIGENEFED